MAFPGGAALGIFNWSSFPFLPTGAPSDSQRKVTQPAASQPATQFTIAKKPLKNIVDGKGSKPAKPATPSAQATKPTTNPKKVAEHKADKKTATRTQVKTTTQPQANGLIGAFQRLGQSLGNLAGVIVKAAS